MLACYRYIELNPVRAGMVTHPRDYRWSSYHANAEGKRNALVTPHEQYLRLEQSVAARFEVYRGLFKAHLDAETIDAIRLATNGNFALGSERFQKEIEQAVKRRAAPGKAGRPRQASDSIEQQDLF